jgi:adenine-specific DNA glycosylase
VTFVPFAILCLDISGLGYYSRASRLLSGAKKVVNMFSGILPDDPSLMEKEVDGMYVSSVVLFSSQPADERTL